MRTDKNEKLDRIANDIKDCRRCTLCEKRTKTVPGSGNPNSDILFVGEAPGKNEDLLGVPFVGAAGKLLEDLLKSIGLERDDIFITNIVKCRPPDNRDPLDIEKSTCSDFLNKQIEEIKPKIIVTLGRHSMSYFLPNLTITACHGKPKRLNGQVYLPLYHPAAALYNGGLRKTLFEDFGIIPKLIKKLYSQLSDNKDNFK